MTIPVNFSRYYISDITGYFFDMASNIKYAQHLVKFNFVRAETVKRAQDSLDDENIIENQKLEYLFLIGFEFAGHVMNNYWMLNKMLANKINDFVHKEFNGNYMIGMQFRFHYLDKVDVIHFLNCSKLIENKNKQIIANRKVKWFISSDDGAFIETLKRNYSDKIVTGIGHIGHVDTNPDAYERALFDIELLSKCDETIITGGSTFGVMSFIKSQKRAYYFEGKKSKKECRKFRFFSPPITPIGAAVFR